LDRQSVFLKTGDEWGRQRHRCRLPQELPPVWVMFHKLAFQVARRPVGYVGCAVDMALAYGPAQSSRPLPGSIIQLCPRTRVGAASYGYALKYGKNYCKLSMSFRVFVLSFCAELQALS